MGNGSATTLAVVVGPILGLNAEKIEMGGHRLFAATGLTTHDLGGQSWANPKWTPKGVNSSSACLTGLHQAHVVQQTALALLHGAVLPAARVIWNRPNLTVDDLDWRAGDLTTRSEICHLFRAWNLRGLFMKMACRAAHWVMLIFSPLGRKRIIRRAQGT